MASHDDSTAFDVVGEVFAPDFVQLGVVEHGKDDCIDPTPAILLRWMVPGATEPGNLLLDRPAAIYLLEELPSLIDALDDDA